MSTKRTEAHRLLDALINHYPMRGDDCPIDSVLGCGKCERCQWVAEFHEHYRRMHEAWYAAAANTEEG